MKPNHDELIRLAKEAGSGLALTMSSNPRISNAMFSGKSLEHFADLVIADFLRRTGQYVTNDASREAALAQARVEEREAILRTAPGDWGTAYDAFKAGKALPNDAPALQYAFAAGMLFEREACQGGAMNDRELLELAAKAVGYELRFYMVGGFQLWKDGKFIRFWNPLEDKGEALWLAVALGFGVQVRRATPCGGRPHAEVYGYVYRRSLPIEEAEDNGESLEKATCRAIVRAAAEIGKLLLRLES